LRFEFCLIKSLIVVSTLISGLGRAETLHISHCLMGCPIDANARNELVVRHLYAASVSPDTHIADWIAYRVVEGGLGVASLLSRDWQTDELVEYGLKVEQLDSAASEMVQANSGSAQASDSLSNEIQISVNDRGRLAPMSSFAATGYWSDINLLSNFAYLKSGMRVGPWSRLDQSINDLVVRGGEYFVISGPVFNVIDQELGNANLPAAYFKIIASSSGEVSGFVFDQDLQQHEAYCAQSTGLEEIESLTGLDIFPQAPDWPIVNLDMKLGC